MALVTQKIQTYEREGLKVEKRILIIQTAFIGDVVLTIPLLKVLKENHNDIEIDFLCIPETSNLLIGNSSINEIIVYDKKGTDKGFTGLIKIIKRIRERKYDIVISPHRSYRSALISFFSNNHNRISFNKSSLSFLYTQNVKYLKNVHEIIRNLKLLEPLGIQKTEIVRPDLFPSIDDKTKVEKILICHEINSNDRFIIVAPGSIWYTKRFPEEKYINLLNYFSEDDIKIVLIGSKSDFELCDRILTASTNNKIYNLAGEFSLLQSVELIKRSKVLITNDSAPMHIANSVGTDVIAIFGATVKDFGFYPYGKNDVVFEINGLDCRPCGIHGGNKCPVKTFDCMLRIDEEEIYRTTLKMLS